MTINNRPFTLLDTNYHVNPNLFSDQAFQGEYSGVNLIYKGFARAGADITEPVWQIAFLQYDGSGNVLSITWPQQILDSVISTINEDEGPVTTPWTSFMFTLTGLPIAKGSVVITVGALKYTDAGAPYGQLVSSGLNSGEINYDTGVVELFFNPSLGMDTEVFASYNTSGLGNASNDYEFIWDERHTYNYV